MHWHIDYLRQESEFIGVIPIRTKRDFEHLLAAPYLILQIGKLKDSAVRTVPVNLICSVFMRILCI